MSFVKTVEPFRLVFAGVVPKSSTAAGRTVIVTIVVVV